MEAWHYIGFCAPRIYGLRLPEIKISPSHVVAPPSPPHFVDKVGGETFRDCGRPTFVFDFGYSFLKIDNSIFAVRTLVKDCCICSAATSGHMTICYSCSKLFEKQTLLRSNTRFCINIFSYNPPAPQSTTPTLSKRCGSHSCVNTLSRIRGSTLSFRYHSPPLVKVVN